MQRSYPACGTVSPFPGACGTEFGTKRTLSWGYGVSADGSCPRFSVPKSFFLAPPPHICLPRGSWGVLMTMVASASGGGYPFCPLGKPALSSTVLCQDMSVMSKFDTGRLFGKHCHKGPIIITNSHTSPKHSRSI